MCVCVCVCVRVCVCEEGDRPTSNEVFPGNSTLTARICVKGEEHLSVSSASCCIKDSILSVIRVHSDKCRYHCLKMIECHHQWKKDRCNAFSCESTEKRLHALNQNHLRGKNMAPGTKRGEKIEIREALGEHRRHCPSRADAR